MDSGNGTFNQVSEDVGKTIENAVEKLQEKHKGLADSIGIFTVGEEFTLKGSRFRIQSIGRSKMKVKLLRRQGDHSK